MTNSQKVIVKTLQKGRDGSTWYCGNPEDVQVCKIGDFCFVPEDFAIFRCISGGLTGNAEWEFICQIEIPDIELPTKVSELENDAGYITEHQDLSGVIESVSEVKLIAENHKHNDYIKSVVEYYSPLSGGMDADDIVVSSALIPLSAEQNAELQKILVDTWAYVITIFYQKMSTDSNRAQLAIGYNSASPRMAFRVYHDGWGIWKPIGTDVISPTVEITETTDGYNISITDTNGTNNIKILHGKNGQDGINGKDGEQGATGAKGEKGDPFTYDDFTAEQLTSLKGEKGDTGLQGEKGEKGDTGAAGKDGANGADGHTPAKGVDYYTEADKTEFVNAVIAALPTAEGASF